MMMAANNFLHRILRPAAGLETVRMTLSMKNRGKNREKTAAFFSVGRVL